MNQTFVSKKVLWAGRIMRGVPILFLLFDGTGKLFELAPVMEGTVRLGYPESAVFWTGVVEITCTILYAIPRCSLLGAILLTGFLGGATAMHIRLGEAFLFPIFVGVLIWGGLFAREVRLLAVLVNRP